METKAIKLKNYIIFCFIHFHQVHFLCNTFAVDGVIGGCAEVANYALLLARRGKSSCFLYFHDISFLTCIYSSSLAL